MSTPNASSAVATRPPLRRASQPVSAPPPAAAISSSTTTAAAASDDDRHDRKYPSSQPPTMSVTASSTQGGGGGNGAAAGAVRWGVQPQLRHPLLPPAAHPKKGDDYHHHHVSSAVASNHAAEHHHHHRGGGGRSGGDDALAHHDDFRSLGNHSAGGGRGGQPANGEEEEQRGTSAVNSGRMSIQELLFRRRFFLPRAWRNDDDNDGSGGGLQGANSTTKTRPPQSTAAPVENGAIDGMSTTSMPKPGGVEKASRSASLSLSASAAMRGSKSAKISNNVQPQQNMEEDDDITNGFSKNITASMTRTARVRHQLLVSRVDRPQRLLAQPAAHHDDGNNRTTTTIVTSSHQPSGSAIEGDHNDSFGKAAAVLMNDDAGRMPPESASASSVSRRPHRHIGHHDHGGGDVSFDDAALPRGPFFLDETLLTVPRRKAQRRGSPQDPADGGAAKPSSLPHGVSKASSHNAPHNHTTTATTIDDRNDLRRSSNSASVGAGGLAMTQSVLLTRHPRQWDDADDAAGGEPPSSCVAALDSTDDNSDARRKARAGSHNNTAPSLNAVAAAVGAVNHTSSPHPATTIIPGGGGNDNTSVMLATGAISATTTMMPRTATQVFARLDFRSLLQRATVARRRVVVTPTTIGGGNGGDDDDASALGRLEPSVILLDPAVSRIIARNGSDDQAADSEEDADWHDDVAIPPAQQEDPRIVGLLLVEDAVVAPRHDPKETGEHEGATFPAAAAAENCHRRSEAAVVVAAQTNPLQEPTGGDGANGTSSLASPHRDTPPSGNADNDDVVPAPQIDGSGTTTIVSTTVDEGDARRSKMVSRSGELALTTAVSSSPVAADAHHVERSSSSSSSMAMERPPIRPSCQDVATQCDDCADGAALAAHRRNDRAGGHQAMLLAASAVANAVGGEAAAQLHHPPQQEGHREATSEIDHDHRPSDGHAGPAAASATTVLVVGRTVATADEAVMTDYPRLVDAASNATVWTTDAAVDATETRVTMVSRSCSPVLVLVMAPTPARRLGTLPPMVVSPAAAAAGATPPSSSAVAVTTPIGATVEATVSDDARSPTNVDHDAATRRHHHQHHYQRVEQNHANSDSGSSDDYNSSGGGSHAIRRIRRDAGSQVYEAGVTTVWAHAATNTMSAPDDNHIISATTASPSAATTEAKATVDRSTGPDDDYRSSTEAGCGPSTEEQRHGGDALIKHDRAVDVLTRESGEVDNVSAHRVDETVVASSEKRSTMDRSVSCDLLAAPVAASHVTHDPFLIRTDQPSAPTDEGDGADIDRRHNNDASRASDAVEQYVRDVVLQHTIVDTALFFVLHADRTCRGHDNEFNEEKRARPSGRDVGGGLPRPNDEAVVRVTMKTIAAQMEDVASAAISSSYSPTEANACAPSSSGAMASVDHHSDDPHPSDSVRRSDPLLGAAVAMGDAIVPTTQPHRGAAAVGIVIAVRQAETTQSPTIESSSVTTTSAAVAVVGEGMVVPPSTPSSAAAAAVVSVVAPQSSSSDHFPKPPTAATTSSDHTPLREATHGSCDRAVTDASFSSYRTVGTAATNMSALQRDQPHWVQSGGPRGRDDAASLPHGMDTAPAATFDKAVFDGRGDGANGNGQTMGAPSPPPPHAAISTNLVGTTSAPSSPSSSSPTLSASSSSSWSSSSSSHSENVSSPLSHHPRHPRPDADDAIPRHGDGGDHSAQRQTDAKATNTTTTTAAVYDDSSSSGSTGDQDDRSGTTSSDGTDEGPTGTDTAKAKRKKILPVGATGRRPPLPPPPPQPPAFVVVGKPIWI